MIWLSLWCEQRKIMILPGTTCESNIGRSVLPIGMRRRIFDIALLKC